MSIQIAQNLLTLPKKVTSEMCSETNEVVIKQMNSLFNSRDLNNDDGVNICDDDILSDMDVRESHESPFFDESGHNAAVINEQV